MTSGNENDNRQYRLDAMYVDARQEILRQVLQATSEGKRSMSIIEARYRAVVDRWRNSPWSEETIGRSLVEASLDGWFSSLSYTDSSRRQLVEDVTEEVFQDPHAAATLELWWNSLVEANA